MKQIRLQVDIPFTHIFGDGRKSWYGKGVHVVPPEVARKAINEGKGIIHRFTPEK